ncbi:MAG: DNA-directed RNA polymerase subunit omega [Nitrospirae bacterium]|nr:DNA-directed RNA polymerase subunit omega [Nitrospirota bacterium]
MDIVSLPVEIEKEKHINRFKLANLAVQRTKELMEGARPVIITRYIKETTIALEEIVSSEFTLLTGKEARKAIMETVREIGAGEEIFEEEDEDSAEIKKDLSVYRSEGEGSGREPEGK